MTEKRNHYAHGFTIVELLIVVVVIGIIGAIVVVAYRGIQQNAENTRTIATVSAYYKAMLAYATTYGSYPSNGAGQPCLGEGYSCTGMGTPVADFNNELRNFLGRSLPQPSSREYTYMSFQRSGAAYYNTRPDVHLNGTPHPYFINYILGGVTSCGGVSNLASIAALGWPFYSSTPPSDGRTETDGTNTYCSIALPAPSTL